MARLFECDMCNTQFTSLEEMQCRSVVVYNASVVAEDGQAAPEVFFDLCGACTDKFLEAMSQLKNEVSNAVD